MADAFSRPATNPNIISQDQQSLSEQQVQPSPTADAAPVEAPVAPQPVQPSQPVQQPYQPDWGAILIERQRAQELEKQNAEMQRKLQDQNVALDNLLRVQQEYNELQRQRQLDQQANEINFDDLASVDADDARMISQQVLKSVQAQLEPLARELSEQRKQIQQSYEYQNQIAAQQLARSTLDKVVSKHPDFISLANDPGFSAFMKQRDGYTSSTLDDRAAEEFRKGNAEYISYIIDQYKQNRPNTASISSVAPVQTATSSQTAPAGQPAQTFTLHDLNTMMQLGQITPDQYRTELAKLRAQFK